MSRDDKIVGVFGTSTPKQQIILEDQFNPAKYLGLGVKSVEHPNTNDPAQTGYVRNTQDAMNHLFTFAANGKDKLLAALRAEGVILPKGSTFEEIARAISQLEGDVQVGIQNLMKFTRESKAYDTEKNVLAVNQPAIQPFQISNYTFQDLPNLQPVKPLDPNVQIPDYDSALTMIKSFASEYRTRGWKYHDLCSEYNPLPSGREHPALSYQLDSGKPTLIIQSATHGNEQHSMMGILEFFKVLMTSELPEVKWARDNLSVMAVMIHNPDGWALYRRRNGTDTSSIYTGVNLNRNWDYFWDYAADPDKGTGAFSEVENKNFKSWLEERDRIKSGVLFYDYHSWWSRTIYGFLTDHNYNHGMKIQTLHRTLINHANRLIGERDYSNLSLTGGMDNMTFHERSSTRKPYAPYWAQQRMERYKGYCCQWEVPQGSESQAVNALVVMDTLHAACIGIRDHLTVAKEGILLDKEVPSTSIKNANSFLQDWSTTYNRPQYFRSEGVVLVNNATRADVFRPKSAAWPKAVISPASASYIHPTDPTKSFFIVAGGGVEGNVETSFCYLEPFVPPTPPPIGSNKYSIYKPTRAQTTIDNLPEAIEDGAMVYCNGYFWYFFGYKGAQGYSNKIYRLPVTTDTDDVAKEMDAKQWQEVKTSTVFTGGLKRHKVIARGNDIYIIGGRDSAGYRRDIVKFDTTNNTETAVGQVGYKNGWFGLEKVTEDKWLYFGGWGGSTCKDDVFEITFPNDVLTIKRVASMPEQRRAFASCVYDGKLYVIGGETASGTYTTNMLVYDINNDSWATLPQSVDGAIGTYEYSNELDDEEDPFTITNIDVTKSASVFNPYDLELNIIAGERLVSGNPSPTITFFELDVDALSLSARKVNDVTWGTFKPSTSFPISNAPSTVTAVVENGMEWDDPDELKINPYARTLNYTGQTWSTTKRWRHKYMVPPRLKKTTMPIYAPTPELNNSKVYSYFRLYGEGTKVTLDSFQVIDGKMVTPRIIPKDGMKEELASFEIDSKSKTVAGAYMTTANGKFALTAPCVKFKTDQGDVAIVHAYDGNGNGKIQVQYLNSSGNATETIDALTFDTNTDAYTNMFKRDIVNFKFNTGDNPSIDLWVYGKKVRIDLTKFGNTTVSEVIPHYKDTPVGMSFYLANVLNN